MLLFHLMRRTRLAAGCLLGLMVGLIAACDTAPGPSDAIQRPPSVSGFSYAPRDLDLLDVDPADIADGSVDVAFDVQVDAEDPDGQIDRVLFVLHPPTQGAQPLAFEQLTESGSGRYTISHNVELATGEIGNYNIVVYAIDNAGLLSNEVLGTFTLMNEGSPPVIDSLDVPGTIQRPATGTQNVVFAAYVSDPDGLANVASVVFWNTDSPGSTFSLFDDGSSGGDETAGDGRFTATLQISSGNAVGINRFAFQATDRAGLKSEIVTQEVAIQ